YDYNTRKEILTKGPLLKSDKNGYFKLPQSKKANEDRLVRLDIRHGNDHLFLDDYQYAPYYSKSEASENDYKDQQEYDEDNGKVFLFTDRSIYRPGQTVYFKGLGVTKNFKNKKTILLQSKDSISVILSDANGQQIDSL